MNTHSLCWVCLLICLAATARVEAQDIAPIGCETCSGSRVNTCGYSDPCSCGGSCGNCDPCGINACCPPPSRLEASVSLLFLQPGGGNLEYGLMASPLPLPTPNWEFLSVEPDLTPAFNVGLRYLLPCAGWDVQLNWTHLDASAHNSATADSTQFVGPRYEIGPDASLYRLARGDVDFQYDAINFDIGQQYSSCGPGSVRLFAGLQYARINQVLAASFQDESGLLANGNTTDSNYSGLGPRLGMQAQLSGCQFDLLGEIAGSLLIGQSQSRIDFTAVSPELAGLGITPPNRQSLTSPDATQVVPGLDCKLGAGYTVGLRRGSQMRFEMGYQAAVYFNALNEYALSEVVTPPVDQSVGVYLRTAEHLQSNFTAHGPYARISWLF